MSKDAHEEARELIACGREDALPAYERSWLQEHLLQCEACRNYLRAADQVAEVLRSAPLENDLALMCAMQLHLRLHAVGLQRRRGRIRLAIFSCLFVVLSAVVTTPLFWRSFGWLGAKAHLSGPVWQTGFALFWIVPALVASVVLLARESSLTETGEMQWS